jgi:hypothetical protein
MLDNCKIFTKNWATFTYQSIYEVKTFFGLILFLCVSILHNKKITVEQIYNGTFRAQGMDVL